MESIQSIDPKKIYIETPGKCMKSLIQFCVEFDKQLAKENEKAGKKLKTTKAKTKEIGSKNYSEKIMCLSCKKETMNKQPVKYYQSFTDTGASKYSIKAMCVECGKCKSKFIKLSDLPKDMKKTTKSSKL